MRYCPTCKKRTSDVYNDFMVAFCSVCYSRRPYDKSPRVAFTCRECGSMQDESYPGQTVCNKCKGGE